MNVENRYRALDSWRGLCACMVTLFHFMVFSHLTFLPLVRHAYLFVDFFFVLSGFVMTASYADKLSRGFGVKAFMLLRFGRIYPLHFAMTIPFIPLLALKSGTGVVFWQALVSNTLLLHGLGLFALGESVLGGLNFPSWSISAEFAAYALFAFAIGLPRKLFWGLVTATIGLCPIALVLFSPKLMNTTFDYGILRCLFGFALGIACFRIHAAMDWTKLIRSKRGGTTLELAITAITIGLVAGLDPSNKLTVLMPLCFALMILIFARETGSLSTILLDRRLQRVGLYSYSIYMVHPLVQLILRGVGYAVQRVTHAPAFTAVSVEGATQSLLGVSAWQGDLATLAMLGGTLGLAALTYRFIEEPGRLWSRGLGLRSRPRATPVGAA